MTPTDDRGAAALAERLQATYTSPWDPQGGFDADTAYILGERGRFLPDGAGDTSELLALLNIGAAELARLRRIEAAARVAWRQEIAMHGPGCDCPIGTTLDAALESDQ